MEAAERGVGSRLIVKNLPPGVGDGELRAHFADRGEVTDARVMTRGGASRCFGFVGFKSEADAGRALRWFHKSYLGAYKLAVEVARPVGDAAIQRPWSKYAAGSSAHAAMTGSNSAPLGGVSRIAKPAAGKAAAGEPEEEDPQLREFLETMQPRARKGKIWSNDDAAALGPAEAAPGPPALADGGGESEDEDYAALPEGRRSSESESESSSDESDSDSGSGGGGEAGGDPAQSDMDWLKSKVTAEAAAEGGAGGGGGSSSASEDSGSGSGSGGDSSSSASEGSLGSGEADGGGHGDQRDGSGEEAAAAAAQPAEAAAAKTTFEDDEAPEDSGRLFVRNLSYASTEEDLRAFFAPFGDISAVHLVVDRETHQSKGYGYVTFMLPEDATKARLAMDKKIFQGRLVHILPASRQGWKAKPAPGPGGTFKEQREADRKANAGQKDSWNALYMRPETVAAWMADHYAVDKSEILDPAAKDLGVRMALGEAQIVAETKRALTEAGVNIRSLDQSVGGDRQKKKALRRSDAALLVKNLHYDTTEGELEALFGRYGSLLRLVLPPTKAVALVEYSLASNAKVAFKALAYKKFHHVPLYVEFAPADIFDGPPPAAKAPPPPAAAGGGGGRGMGGLGAANAANLGVQEFPAPGEAPEEAQALTVFVKNVAFRTDAKALERHFKQGLSRTKATAGLGAAAVRSASVSYKTGPKGAKLSNGFGFVEFANADAARRALEVLQGTSLDGHALRLELSVRKGAKVTRVPEGQGGVSATKLLVRNIPFEANDRDIKQLFAPFGEVKTLRMPQKFDGQHRGFAFVDYLFNKDAHAAYAQLNGTHLLGRRLILEKAKAETEDGAGPKRPREDADAAAAAAAAAGAGAVGAAVARKVKKSSKRRK